MDKKEPTETDPIMGKDGKDDKQVQINCLLLCLSSPTCFACCLLPAALYFNTRLSLAS